MQTACRPSAAMTAIPAAGHARQAIAAHRKPSVSKVAAQAASQATAVAAAPAPAPAAVTPAAPLAGSSAAALEGLSRLPHPSALHTGNLAASLQAALAGLQAAAAAPAGGAGREAAAAASPLLRGLLSRAVAVLEAPQAIDECLGVEAPLLVLECLSHLAAGSGGDSRGGAHTAGLWRRAHVVLGETADRAGMWSLLDPSTMTPIQIVRYYEAVARWPLAASPSKSRGLGFLLRSHLRNGRFSAGEASRLLTAWAYLRRRQPFNPDAYNYSDLSTLLAGHVGELCGSELQAVAAAAPAFSWPVYSSMPLLHAVCREAVHRSMAGALPLPQAQWVLAASVKGAMAMRPRLGTELEEATADWMQAAAAARRARHAAAAQSAPAAQGRSNIVMYAAAATAAPLLGASMLLAAAALGVATGAGSVDFA